MTSRWARTERRTSAAVCLLVDLSYSMALRGTWGVGPSRPALALHALIRSRYPSGLDSGDRLLELPRASCVRSTWAGLGWDMVQGTNLPAMRWSWPGVFLTAGPSTTRWFWSSPTRARATAHLPPRRAVLVRLAAVARDARRSRWPRWTR